MTTLMPFDRITVDPSVMNGRPCIRGMRVQVSLILNLTADGMPAEEILKAYPYIGWWSLLIVKIFRPGLKQFMHCPDVIGESC